LLEEWAVIEDLLGELEVTEWLTSTTLPGWTVHDIVAHLIGTESRLAGDEEPPSSVDVTSVAYVHNSTGAANEQWVRLLRPELPEAMLARFHDVTKRRAKSLSATSLEEFDAPTQTPVGIAPYRRLMEIRVFDCWLHEQDIRWAVGRPGHQDGRCAEAAIDEVVRALGFIVGKRASAPDGSAFTIELIGPVWRTVHVAVSGRAAVVTKLDRPVTATLYLPSTVFVRLAGGRVDALSELDRIRLSGDHYLGRRLAENLAFTI
jgi:uncharacterized protein (TIGR03083 family)